MTEAYNVDCMDYLKDIPDGYFDLCIADPPYGIGITDKHRKKDSASLVGGGGRLAALMGKPKNAISSPHFTPCSTIAPRRTKWYLGSWNEYQET